MSSVADANIMWRKFLHTHALCKDASNMVIKTHLTNIFLIARYSTLYIFMV